MNIEAITPVEKHRLKAFKETLRQRGRAMTTSDGDKLTAVPHDQPLLTDTDHTAQAKLPVYTMIHALAGSVTNPRTLTTFTDLKSGRNYDVIRYEESAADNISWKWFCEAQRLG